MVTVDQEQELHKPNSWIKRESSVVVRIVNISCVSTVLNTWATSFSLLHWIEKQKIRDGGEGRGEKSWTEMANYVCVMYFMYHLVILE